MVNIILSQDGQIFINLLNIALSLLAGLFVLSEWRRGRETADRILMAAILVIIVQLSLEIYLKIFSIPVEGNLSLIHHSLETTKYILLCWAFLYPASESRKIIGPAAGLSLSVVALLFLLGMLFSYEEGIFLDRAYDTWALLMVGVTALFLFRKGTPHKTLAAFFYILLLIQVIDFFGAYFPAYDRYADVLGSALYPPAFFLLAIGIYQKNADALLSKNRWLGAVAEINELALGSKGKDFDLSEVLKITMKGLGFKTGALMLSRPDKEEEKLCGVVTVGGSIMEVERSDTGNPLLLVYKSGKPLLIKDASKDPGIPEEVRRGFGNNMSSILSPVRVHDKVIGVLALSVKEGQGRAGYSDLSALNMFSDHLGMALEREMLAKEMAVKQSHLNTLFDGVGEGICLLDRDLNIVSTNRFLRNIMKYSENELVGKKCYEMFHQSESVCVDCPVKTAFDTNRPATTSHSGVTKDGRVTTVELTAYPLADESGLVNVAVEIIRDISEKKEMQERLIKTERLSAIGQTAAGIVHDVKNPLSSLNILLSMLKDTDDVRDSRKFISQAEGEIKKIDGIVSRLLDFTVADENRQGVSEVKAELSKVVKELVLRAFERKVNIVSDLAGPLPQVAVDPVQLRRVFANLISNAVEAMDNGGELRITAGLEETSTGGRAVRVMFTDTGPGIPEDLAQRVFEPFVTTKENGSGLGLFVSRQIARANGGDIILVSRQGFGSIFTVMLPIKTPARMMEDA